MINAETSPATRAGGLEGNAAHCKKSVTAAELRQARHVVRVCSLHKEYCKLYRFNSCNPALLLMVPAMFTGRDDGYPEWFHFLPNLQPPDFDKRVNDPSHNIKREDGQVVRNIIRWGQVVTVLPGREEDGEERLLPALHGEVRAHEDPS